MSNKEIIYLKVVRSEIYAFEENSINGWDTEQVIEDWFRYYPLDKYHATRDSHKVGNSDKIVSINEIAPKEVEEEMEEDIDN